MGHLVGGHAEAVAHELIRFADDLHVAVFDAVVDHFDVMARAIFAHPIAARRPILDLRRDFLENLLHMRPCGRGTAGHDARAVARAFLASGHARADVKQTFRLDVFRAAIGVFEKGIAAVDDDVAGFQSREEMFDELIAEIRGLKKGAFAPLTQQPFIHAIIFPSGSVGLLAVGQRLLGIS